MPMLAARLAPLHESDRRDAGRREVGRDSTLRSGRQSPIDVLVLDLSEHGFSVKLDLTLALDSTVRLGLPGVGTACARVVRRDGDTYGCEFIMPLSRQDVASAFAEEGVVAFPTAVGDDYTMLEEPEIERWPVPARAAVIIGGSGLLWAGIGLAIHAAFF